MIRSTFELKFHMPATGVDKSCVFAGIDGLLRELIQENTALASFVTSWCSLSACSEVLSGRAATSSCKRNTLTAISGSSGSIDRQLCCPVPRRGGGSSKGRKSCAARKSEDKSSSLAKRSAS